MTACTLGKEAVMEITDEMVEEACERAERALEELDEDGRWALLRARVEEEHRLSYEACMRRLELDALRDRVAPNVDRKDWAAALGGRAPLDRWFHERRLAHALGSKRKKL
jgi:hypothetical protein